MAIKPGELFADGVEGLEEVLAVRARDAHVQVGVAGRQPAHVAKAAGRETGGFGPVAAPRQGEHVADRQHESGVAHAGHLAVVCDRVHEHRVRADRGDQLGDSRLVAREHPRRAFEHRRVCAVDPRGLLAAHRVAADEVDPLGRGPLHDCRLGAGHVGDRNAPRLQCELREQLAHGVDRRADDDNLGHLHHGQVRVCARYDVALQGFAHDERVLVAAHENDVGPRLLECQRERGAHKSEPDDRDRRHGASRPAASALRPAAAARPPSGGRRRRSPGTARRRRAPGSVSGGPR